MNISQDLRLAEIVDLVPGAPRVLESFGLDYCCGGQKTLEIACKEIDRDPSSVVEAIEALEAGPVPDWVSMSPQLLVNHIESTHHAYLHAELPRLEALAEKVAGVHGARHPELLEVHRGVTALKEDMEPHLMKEERVLFPMIRELATATAAPQFHCGSVANPISNMMSEHEVTGGILESLRAASGGYILPDEACASDPAP